MFVVWVLFGLAELLFPRQFVDFWMSYAVEEDGEVRLRPWVYTAARVEGAVIVLWALARRRRGSARPVTD
jgi:hypothetical protein